MAGYQSRPAASRRRRYRLASLDCFLACDAFHGLSVAIVTKKSLSTSSSTGLGGIAGVLDVNNEGFGSRSGHSGCGGGL